MEKYTYQILLNFSNREMANKVFAILRAQQVGYTMQTKTETEELFPVIRVAFDNTARRYTYLLTEELAEKMKCPKERNRNYPTSYGLTYGEGEPVQWLTKGEINKIYPFEKIVKLSK